MPPQLPEAISALIKDNGSNTAKNSINDVDFTFVIEKISEEETLKTTRT